MDKAQEHKKQGNHFANISQYHMAIEYYKKAIDECDTTKPESQPLLADVYHNIASMYHLTDQNHLAKELAEKASQINITLSRDNHIQDDIYLLSNILIAHDDLVAAETLICDIDLNALTGELKERFTDINTKLASAYLKKNDLIKSYEYALKSVESNHSLSRNDHFYASLFLLSANLVMQNKLEQCEKLLQQPLLDCESVQARDLLGQTYEDIATQFKSQQQTEKADHYYQLSLQIRRKG